MMRRFWTFITDARRLTIIGLAAMAALFYLGAEVLELALIWAIAATVLMLLIAAGIWWWHRRSARRDAEQLAQAIVAPTPADAVPRDQSPGTAPDSPQAGRFPGASPANGWSGTAH